MKQIKFLAVAALVAAIALPAMAETKVTFSGYAKARFGAQYMKTDNTDMQSLALLAGLKEDTKAATVYAALSNTTNAATTAVNAMTYDTLRNTAASAYNKFLGGTGVPTAADYTAVDAASPFAPMVTGAGTFTSMNAIANALVKAGMDTAITALNGPSEAAAYAAVRAAFSSVLSPEDTLKLVRAYQSGKAAQGLLVGQKVEQSTRLDLKIEDDKLTFKVGAELDSTNGFVLKQAAIAFDYGIGAVTFDDAGLQGRYNGDIFYVGTSNTSKSSIDFTLKPGENMGNVFFTLMSNKALAGVKYENTANRTIPIMQLGYEYKSDMVDVTGGYIYDKFKGGTTNVKQTGYMGFGTLTFKVADIKKLDGDMAMAVSLSGLVGQNVVNFANMKATDLESASISLNQFGNGLSPLSAQTTVSRSAADKDAHVRGMIVSAGITPWKGGLISGSYRISELTLGGEPYTAYKAELAVTQYFSKNFYVLLGGGTESYSVAPGDQAITGNPIEAAYGYEGTLEFGYKF